MLSKDTCVFADGFQKFRRGEDFAALGVHIDHPDLSNRANPRGRYPDWDAPEQARPCYKRWRLTIEQVADVLQQQPAHLPLGGLGRDAKVGGDADLDSYICLWW